MVHVLAVSDEVVDSLVSPSAPAARQKAFGNTVELIVGCGDLPFDYLAALVNVWNAPLVFVPGNHDPDVSGFRLSRAGLPLRAGVPTTPPWPPGAVNADGAIVTEAGLRIAGLGGCLRYRAGPNQYSQRRQRIRAGRLSLRSRLHRSARGIDLLLTHAPPRGCGDGVDGPHIGFDALHPLVSSLRPRHLLHGHIHPYGTPTPDRRLGGTVVSNVIPYRYFDIAAADPVSR